MFYVTSFHPIHGKLLQQPMEYKRCNKKIKFIKYPAYMHKIIQKYYLIVAICHFSERKRLANIVLCSCGQVLLGIYATRLLSTELDNLNSIVWTVYQCFYFTGLGRYFLWRNDIHLICTNMDWNCRSRTTQFQLKNLLVDFSCFPPSCHVRYNIH